MKQTKLNSAIVSRLLPALALGIVLWTERSVRAQDFRVTNAVINTQGKFSVGFPSATNSYFILKRGTLVTNANTAVAMQLGQAGGGQLVDSTNASASARSFFRVQQVLLSAPLDTDGDMINDVFELQNPPALNPLNAADAGIDFDGDSVNSLNEFKRGTNPNNAGSVNITLFADAVTGNDAFNGLSPTVNGANGPKKTIQGGLAVAFNGDVLEVAAGSYPATTLTPPPGDVILRPVGNVVIQ